MAVMYILLAVFFKSAVAGNEVCYPNYGCFSKHYPFNHLSLPEHPNKVGTRFWLFTRMSPHQPEELSDTEVYKLEASKFDGSRPTKVVVHGYQFSKSN